MDEHDITIDYDLDRDEWVCVARSTQGSFGFRGPTPQAALAHTMRRIAVSAIRSPSEAAQRAARAAKQR